MGEVRIRGDIVEEELRAKKPTLIKVTPRRVQANGLFLQPWPKPSKPLHKLATIPENDTEENTDNGGAATFAEDREKEKKYRRTISNRHSARRSRLRQLSYMAQLENTAKSFENDIDILHRQIAAQQKEKRSLQIEHHTLKFHMAACEKQRILQESEIEKNKAEVDRLSEVQKKIAAERKMLSITSLQLRSKFNF